MGHGSMLGRVLLLATCVLAVRGARHPSVIAHGPAHAPGAGGGYAVGAAPAPGVHPSGAAAVGPHGAAAPQWWPGMSIVEARKKLEELQMSGGDLSGAGVTNIDVFAPMSDDELYEVFTTAVPDVPGKIPGDEDIFMMCSGDALINTFTNESWPTGPWPQGGAQPQVNFNKRVWKGKVIYTNPKTNVTQLWNLMWSNSTAEATGIIYPLEKGYSPDGKPSVVVDYFTTEALWDRALRDEIRRVGPSTWLGVAWVVDPVTFQNPSYLGPLQPVVDAFKPLQNATYKGVLEAIGVQGPNSSPITSGLTMPEPGQPLRLTYFAIDCQPNAVPKLQYTSTAQVFHLLSMAGGFMPLGQPLPELNSVAGDKAVENWAKEFPNSSDGDNAPPFVLWPFKLSELGPIGYIKFPAYPFEPIFGEFWRYDFSKDLKALGFMPLAPAPAPEAAEEEDDVIAEAPALEA